jgi:hypothetical protein
VTTPERQVGNDNCVSFRKLKLQIPESPMRPHFVKARVKVHAYPDGSDAVFHGPRCVGRYEEKGKPNHFTQERHLVTRLQAETLCSIGRMARPRRLLAAGVWACSAIRRRRPLL